MHISDGVLPLTVTIGGYVASAGLAAWSARRTSSEDLPKVAVVTAAFFVASLIHVPLGPTSAHLLMPGLAGALLLLTSGSGAMAYPANRGGVGGPYSGAGVRPGLGVGAGCCQTCGLPIANEPDLVSGKRIPDCESVFRQGDDVPARLGLVVRGDRILEIEVDDIRIRGRHLLEDRGPRAGAEELAAVRAGDGRGLEAEAHYDVPCARM